MERCFSLYPDFRRQPVSGNVRPVPTDRRGKLHRGGRRWYSSAVHPQRGHGIFRGNDNRGQRICCGDGTAPPAAADHHSYVCDVSLLSHGCGRMERYWGRHADAWRPLWWWKSRCDFRVSDCPHDDLLRQNRRGTVPGSPYAGIGRPGKTDEYL